MAEVPSKKCPNFARALYANLNGYGNTQFMVKLPLVWPDDPEMTESDPWETWNEIRTVCEHHASITVALELTGDLPDQSTLDQWGAEQVKLVIIPTSLFLTNAAGFPVLSKRHQHLLFMFFSRKVSILHSPPPPPHNQRHQDPLVLVPLELTAGG